jgi:uncharacterized protein YutE (UPF0331/DUF86 family)
LVDADSTTNRLQRLDELLRELDAIRAGGRDAYMAEPRTRLATEHALQLAIQSCIDIGAHLISELGLTAPADYRGVFASLASAGLEQGLAERLAAAAGMRNILVHGYLDVDSQLVWDALARLDDLRAFAETARRIVDGGRGKGSEGAGDK